MSRRQLPAVQEPEKAVGLQTDGNFWGSLVLLVGSPASKLLTYFEHVEFLASVKNGGFKMMLDIWDSGGWWIMGAVGLIWFGDRFFRRSQAHQKGPTWGLVVACTIMAAIYSSILTVQLSGAFPDVVTTKSIYSFTNAFHATRYGCAGQIDGSRLLSFKTDYKVALACVLVDPSVDQLSDKRILVSQLDEIVDGTIPVVANKSPDGDFEIESPTVSVNYMAILVPKAVDWSKINTLNDLLQLNGKVLDSRYY